MTSQQRATRHREHAASRSFKKSSARIRLSSSIVLIVRRELTWWIATQPGPAILQNRILTIGRQLSPVCCVQPPIPRGRSTERPISLCRSCRLVRRTGDQTEVEIIKDSINTTKLVCVVCQLKAGWFGRSLELLQRFVGRFGVDTFERRCGRQAGQFVSSLASVGSVTREE